MLSENSKLTFDFYRHDTVLVAQRLLSKILVRRFADGTIHRYRITETEAYCGIADLACHASKGKTKRTQVMFNHGGYVYVYLIYGMFWLLNIVSGDEGDGSAVLIRGLDGFNGPGRLGRELKLDSSFYGENLETSERLWIEDAPAVDRFDSTPRIGVDYAGEPWISMPWRFVLE